MKRLKHIVNVTIWSLVSLYLLLMVLVHVPAVQSWLGRRASRLLSDKLQTEVSVGRVSLGLTGRVVADSVAVLDQERRDLLTIGRLTARVSLLPLLEGRVQVASVQVFGLHAHLCRATAEAPLNAQFIVDALSSDSDGPLSTDVRINSIIIRHSSVTYDQLDAAPASAGLDRHHLAFTDISGHLALKALRPDTLHAIVRRLAFRERSGLQVDRLGLSLQAGEHDALLSGLVLKLPHTVLTVDILHATYASRERLAQTLRLEPTRLSATLSPSDFSFFSPCLSALPHPIDLEAEAEGTPHDLSLSRLTLSTPDDDLSLQARGTLLEGRWQADVARLHLSGTLLSAAADLLPAALQPLAPRLGSLTLSGTATVEADQTGDVRADVATDLGSLGLQLSRRADGALDGHVATEGLHLGRLTGNEQLGLLAATADIGVQQGGAVLTAEGLVAHLDYRDHSYHDATIDIVRREGTVAGHLRIADSAVEADVEGSLSSDALRLTGHVSHLCPKALNLTDRWGDARISAIVDADFAATSLNDAQGSIDLDDLRMTLPSATPDGQDETLLSIDNVHVKSGYADGRHYVRLTSDMAEAELTGRFDWSTLPQSIVAHVASRLPTLPGLPARLPATNNNFEASLRMSSAQWLRHLAGVPLTLHEGMRLQIAVSDSARQLTVSGELPDFTYDHTHYTAGRVHVDTQADTTTCAVSLTQQLAGGRHNRLSLTAEAAHNMLSTALRWHLTDATGDPLQTLAGELRAQTSLYTNEQGRPEAQVRIRPSQMTLKGVTWQVEPSDILFTDSHLLVDHFAITHGANQHLIVDGPASASLSDTLRLSLGGVDISHLLTLANFRAVRFGGQVTGQATLAGVFGQPEGEATLTAPSLLFQEGDMGRLTAHATWSSTERRLRLNAMTDADPAARTLINGLIDTGEGTLALDFDAQGSPIAFVHSFTRSFLDSISGHAYGHLRLGGTLKQLDLSGRMRVEGEATVAPLGTTYTMRGAQLDFAPGSIAFSDFTVSDRDGQTGRLSGAVHHHHLKQFTYDLSVDADRLLAFDKGEASLGGIAGSVRATGRAVITGRPGEVVIDCDLTPTRGSSFTYDATSPDAVSQQQFITWGTAAAATPAASSGEPSVVLPPQASKSDLRVNFRINATPDLTLRLLMNRQTGDNISLAGNGVITASYYNKGPFQMFGTYTVSQGTYGMTLQNIIKKTFAFQDGGTVVFGGNPFDAAINLQAVYTVNGVSLSDLSIGQSFTNNTVRVNCLMNIGGTAGSPTAEFDLDMPTVNTEEKQMIRSVIASEQELNQQVLYLLAIGRFYTQGNNNEGQQYDQTQLAMQSFLSGTVSTQINELLSQVINLSDWNFGANISTGNEGWHNAEYEGVISGRLLDNRLLINGQFGYRDNATQASPSFIGDFDLRYLLTPSGNLALKVYNQTNDRYFTRSALNTQGVGIIVKRDFSGLADLFHLQRRKRQPAASTTTPTNQP